jgi:signal transduction histidine kinase
MHSTSKKNETQKKTTADTLAACGEADLRLFIDNLSYACILLDRDFRIIHCNRPMELYFLGSVESARGRPLGIASAVRRVRYREVMETGASIVLEDILLGCALGPRLFRISAFRIAEDLCLVLEDLDAKGKDPRDGLGTLASHLLKAREDERKRVAREIHDELGQAITAIDMGLKSLLRRQARDGADRESIEALIDQAEQTVDAVRRIATELRPAILDNLGLLPALEWFVEDFGRRASIAICLVTSLEGAQIGERAATALFRITQESLTNVARHARAASVRVSLRREGECILLEIEDDGVGIPQERILDPASFGLLGMRERASELGGRLDVVRAPGKGTMVAASIPIEGTGKLP